MVYFFIWDDQEKDSRDGNGDFSFQLLVFVLSVTQVLYSA